MPGYSDFAHGWGLQYCESYGKHKSSKLELSETNLFLKIVNSLNQEPPAS